MAEAAVKRPFVNNVPMPHEPIAIRRFEMPDLHQHGGWLSERLLTVYRHVTQQTIWGWLNMLLNNNEFLFLYLPNAVALAQIMRGHTLAPKPLVHERFVFVQNKEDETQITEAVRFYDDFHRWAKQQDADAIVLSELSDVPQERIKVGRRFEKMQAFLKVVK